MTQITFPINSLHRSLELIESENFIKNKGLICPYCNKDLVIIRSADGSSGSGRCHGLLYRPYILFDSFCVTCSINITQAYTISNEEFLTSLEQKCDLMNLTREGQDFRYIWHTAANRRSCNKNFMSVEAPNGNLVHLNLVGYFEPFFGTNISLELTIFKSSKCNFLFYIPFFSNDKVLNIINKINAGSNMLKVLFIVNYKSMKQFLCSILNVGNNFMEFNPQNSEEKLLLPTSNHTNLYDCCFLAEDGEHFDKHWKLMPKSKLNEYLITYILKQFQNFEKTIKFQQDRLKSLLEPGESYKNVVTELNKI